MGFPVERSDVVGFRSKPTTSERSGKSANVVSLWVHPNVLSLWVRNKVAEKRFTVVGDNRKRSDVVGSVQKPITVERFKQSSLGKSEMFYRCG